MHIERLFTAGSLRPQDSMHFVIAGSPDAPPSPHLVVPDEWSFEASQSFSEALCLRIPAHRRTVEENTLPSWLWRHRAKDDATTAESSVLDVVTRIAGAATYRGWKAGLWDDEVVASAFFDELQAVLLSRRLILAPSDMASLGLDWAYGLDQPSGKHSVTSPHYTAGLILQNETIDSILRRTQPQAQNKWVSLLENSMVKTVTRLSFADTIAQWGVLPSADNAPRAMLNMMAFRTLDGNVDVQGLQQTTRLTVILLDLFYEELAGKTSDQRALSIGFGNMASLLMSLALPYDSDEGRGTAASLAAITTASATITSANLAIKLGPCAAYARQHDACLRSLRNQLRATFGEKNDYDRLSILPQTLEIESGTDLVLISTARHLFEEAIRLTQSNGLRHLQLTAVFQASEMLALMDSTTSGTEAEASLTCEYAIGGDQFQRRARPALRLGLEKLGYESDDIKAINEHVIGYKTLLAAPCINRAVLREKGFDDLALRRVEALLPYVRHIRSAFTPWVVGLAFCQTNLRLKSKDLVSPQLDLLKHLGFTTREIDIANAFCCGHNNIRGVSELRKEHAAVFETRDHISHDAHIRMAAAMQSFISGDVDLTLTIPITLSAAMRGEIALNAWALGIKSLTLAVDAPHRLAQAVSVQPYLMKRKTKGLTTEPVALTKRKNASATTMQARALKPKATVESVSLKQRTQRSVTRTKRV